MTPTAVLDSSAILAVILAETGADAVLDSKASLAASTVNISEVRSKLVDLGYARESIDLALERFGLREIAFDAEQAAEAGELRRTTRKAGLSLGDRACLALAMNLGAPAMTADRNWTTVEVPVTVELIR